MIEEKIVGKGLGGETGFLDKAKTIVKKTVYLTATALVIGTAPYGCGGEEPSECCKQLSCPSGGDYQCADEPSDGFPRVCVRTDAGVEECCGCKYTPESRLPLSDD